MGSRSPNRRASDSCELRPTDFDHRGSSSSTDAHQTHNTSAQKFASQLAGVLRHRCDYCGGHLWLIVYHYYRMRFCCKAHMQAYQQRLTTDTRAKIRELELLTHSSS